MPRTTVMRASASGRQPARSMLRPVVPTRNLTEEVVARLADEIETGRLSPGTRLPTEQAMVSAMGVSRTVVREAVAALRARGLVTTRQGAGAFVTTGEAKPYVIAVEGLGSLETVHEVLELRLAVEVETAALAAQRAAPRQLTAIRKAHEVFSRALEKNQSAVLEDYAFHAAIAAATGNRRFSEFLEFLGRIIIPRQTIRTAEREDEAMQYLLRIRQEHEAIVTAIESGSPEAARTAARIHLTNSAMRYKSLGAAKG